MCARRCSGAGDLGATNIFTTTKPERLGEWKMMGVSRSVAPCALARAAASVLELLELPRRDLIRFSLGQDLRVGNCVVVVVMLADREIVEQLVDRNRWTAVAGILIVIVVVHRVCVLVAGRSCLNRVVVILVQVDLRPHVLVLFEVVEELLVVDLVLAQISSATWVRNDLDALDLLEFPRARALLDAPWELLLHEDDVRQRNPRLHERLEVVVVEDSGREVVPECGVADVEQIRKVARGYKPRVVHTKVSVARDFEFRKPRLAARADRLAAANGNRHGRRVEDRERAHRFDRPNRFERVPPVLFVVDLGGLGRERIDDVDRRRHALDEHEARDVADQARELKRQDNEVVFADWRDVDHVRELVVVRVAVVVGRDELLRVLELDGHALLEKVDEPQRVVPLDKEEVDAVRVRLDRRRLVMRFVFQDQLLEEEERAFVVDALPHLHDRAPRLVRKHALTVVALLVPNDERHDERLLQDHFAQHLLLDRELELEALRVRLGPDPVRVNELDLVEVVDLLEADREELARLELGDGPWRPRPLEASAALVDDHFLWDALGDVDLALEAAHAHVGGIRLDRRRAHAT